ncbi:MAG TPA: zinc-dependent metalloprotease [Acidimicrobiia bacterium]|jgi:coenzyme F420 biosynthesis associated uncharacterized protein
MALPGEAPVRGAAEPVDWRLAERIACRVAGREPLSLSYLGGSLDRDFREVTVEAEEAVAALTGLHGPTPGRAMVVDRAAWVENNVSSMRRMLAPYTERVRERLARSPIAPIGRTVAGGELGVLLGYVAQRVLGQYDLLMPDENDGGHAGDTVYYVGPNILVLEKRYAFRPRDFRLWIALHELTHRAQFTGVPWLHGYFVEQVGTLLGSVEPDARRLLGAAGRAVDDLRKGRNPLDDGVVALFANEDQRLVLDRMQALMSLLEGHGNAVMNKLGAQMVEGQDRMASALHARRNARGTSALFQRVLGLEMKMRQYEVGEAFVASVEREAGVRAIDAAWRGPEFLPTLAELTTPTAWLERVGAGASAAR